MNELNWVDFLSKKVKKGSGVLRGIGDDCALVKVGKEKLLLKSDLFVEDIHFKKGKTKYQDLGMRAVARVFSDFAACGGVPKFIGASIAAPPYLKEKDLKQILKGILKICEEYKCSLIGGDTSKGNKLFLDIWGIGIAKRFIARDSAKIGDHIFITGKLGKNKFNLPFGPKINEAQYLIKNFKVNSMIDISDGFVVNLLQILKMSKKSALIYKNDIPLCGESDLNRGEDYELIFTIDKSEPKLKILKNKFYLIGEIKNYDKNRYLFWRADN